MTRTQAHKIKLLDIALEHIGVVENLPYHHRDPFDRLIIAQGIFEKFPILADDTLFDSYPIQRLWQAFNFLLKMWSSPRAQSFCDLLDTRLRPQGCLRYIFIAMGVQASMAILSE